MLQKQFNKLITYSNAITPKPTNLYKQIKLNESWVGVSLYCDKPSNSPLQLEGIKSPD